MVHLAGTGIADKRWTPEQKQRIVESRAGRPRCSPRRSPGLDRSPAVLVSGSAIGWYGNRGAEILTEASPAPSGPDFLADVCRQWEAATAPAEAAGIRTVHLRTGIVLAAEGGCCRAW